MPMRTWLAKAAVLALTLGACTPDVPQDAVPARVVAIFDPTAQPAPVVPLPNDLAVDAATGLLALPDLPDQTAAEKAFNRYLRTLDGFPTAATATLNFSALLDASTV